MIDGITAGTLLMLFVHHRLMCRYQTLIKQVIRFNQRSVSLAHLIPSPEPGQSSFNLLLSCHDLELQVVFFQMLSGRVPSEDGSIRGIFQEGAEAWLFHHKVSCTVHLTSPPTSPVKFSEVHLRSDLLRHSVHVCTLENLSKHLNIETILSKPEVSTKGI